MYGAAASRSKAKPSNGRNKSQPSPWKWAKHLPKIQTTWNSPMMPSVRVRDTEKGREPIWRASTWRSRGTRSSASSSTWLRRYWILYFEHISYNHTMIPKIYQHLLFLLLPKKGEAKKHCKPPSKSVEPCLSSVVVLLSSKTRSFIKANGQWPIPIFRAQLRWAFQNIDLGTDSLTPTPTRAGHAPIFADAHQMRINAHKPHQ